MEKSNRKRALQIGVSLLVACVIWLFVDFSRSEESAGNRPTKVVENVPIEYVGESTTLASRGLMRIAGEDDVATVTLELRGKRWDLAALDTKALKVQVDLSTVTSVGVQSLNYQVVYPDENDMTKITTTKATPSRIAVNIGELYRQNVEIVPTFSGSVAEGYIAGEIRCKPETLELWGKQSEVMQVKEARVRLDIDDASATVVQLLEYELYDHNGKLIENPNIHAAAESIQVTLPVDMVKVLPLELKFEEAPGLRLSNVEYDVTPASITVIGDAGILDTVDSIALDTIVLSEIGSGTSRSYPIKLPEGCENSSGVTEATVRVAFKDLTTVQVVTTNLTYANPPADKTVSLLSTDLTVTLRGTSADLAAVFPGDVLVTADLSQVENASGNYTVPAAVTVDTDGDVGVVGTYQLKLNVSETPPEASGEVPEPGGEET